MSLPSRERGLKSVSNAGSFANDGSLPSRERGLKLNDMHGLVAGLLVAPFTGAWIEMLPPERQALARMCRSLHGSVD